MMSRVPARGAGAGVVRLPVWHGWSERMLNADGMSVESTGVCLAVCVAVRSAVYSAVPVSASLEAMTAFAAASRPLVAARRPSE